MATNNIKIFDENKGNMMSTQEYSTNAQRLNGVQQGIASSMLQNKTLYQLSLVAYAIGQMMVNNGLDANDDNAVSAFVGNLANTIVQKVVDKASTAEAQAGIDANKFMTPATTRAAINVLKATSQMATAGTDTTHWMTPALVKQVVDASLPEIKLIKTQNLPISSSSLRREITNWASGFSTYDKLFFQFSCNTSEPIDSANFHVELMNNGVIAYLDPTNLSTGSYTQLYFGFSAEKSNDIIYINGTDLTAQYARNGPSGDMSWQINYRGADIVSNAYIPLAAANSLPLYIVAEYLQSSAGTLTFTCKIYGVKLYK